MRYRRHPLGIALGLALVLITFGRSVVAQDAVAESETKEDRTHAFADEEIKQYAFKDPSGQDCFELVPRSLLRWSKTLERTAFGDTYLFTERGCARAIISIFSIQYENNRSISAECQSLSDKPFAMYRNGSMVWAPSTGGIEFKPLKEVTMVASTPTARGAQMNRIARTFRAEFSPHTAPDQITQLRLLSRPLYRYRSSDPSVVDGAVYGFVDATDPEMLLLIEARKVDEREQWFYAPARSRHDALKLYQNQQLVWDVPRLAPPWSMIRQPSGTYFNLQLESMVDPKWLEVFSLP